jgi:predicted nucleotidyltransferase
MKSITTAQPARLILTDVLYQCGFAEAAVLYGSVARGDFELHSDIDVLLLCESGKKRVLLESIESLLIQDFQKLSLAVYSRQELAFLDKANSLFLLHLQREADVLFDRSGYLSALLSNFRAKRSYEEDFRESVGLVDALRTSVANAPNQFHRLSYIYSLFRVFGVYLLAQKGEYEFSKSKMVASLSREYPDCKHAVLTLSELRPLNANFFAGASPDPTLSLNRNGHVLPTYVAALARTVNETVEVVERPYHVAVEEFCAAAKPFGCFNYRLRMWFLLLVYDGINLVCKKSSIPSITSFQPDRLEALISTSPFPAVSVAADLVISYIRNYRLKYFLSDRMKMEKENCLRVLRELALEAQ